MKRYIPPDLDFSADPALRARSYLDAVRADLAARRLAGESGLEGALALSDAYDVLLRAAFAARCAKEDLLLVGVGGYGRGEVSPRSDVDLVLIYPEGEAETTRKAAESFLYLLWDAKLDVGHATRSPTDWRALIQEKDLTALTSLLDARLIAGSSLLWGRLLALRAEVLGGEVAEFLPLLAEEREKRRERYGGAVFLLEPELKRGEGGLRDLDLARWAARLSWNVLTLEELVAQKILPPRLVDPLLEARENLLTLRGFLHDVAGRRADRLTFDKQEEIARLRGQAVEELMRGYYRWARAISTGVDEIFDRARLWSGAGTALAPSTSFSTAKKREGEREEIDEDFFREGDRLLARNEALFFQNPCRIVRAFVVARAHGLRLHPKTRDQIADAVPKLAALVKEGALARYGEEPWKSFGEILTSRETKPVIRGHLQALRSGAEEGNSGPAASWAGSEPSLSVWSGVSEDALETMHALGVLGALIPEWEPLSGLWLQDLYHVYTVDVHTLHAVRALRSFFQGDPAFPLERELARRIDNPFPLFLGMLLHDIGKQFGANEHSLAGARLVPEIAARMALPTREVEEISFLVEHHLLLTRLAFRRDTTDPALLSELAEKMGSVGRLRALYLITLADVSAVGPGVLNDWKARLLRDLYFRTADVIGRGELLTTPPRVSFSEKIPENVAEAILASRAPSSLLYESPEELERQVACAALLLASSPGAPRLRRNGSLPSQEGPFARAEISVFVREDQGSSEAIVCAPDAAGLLAEIAGVFSAAGIDILEARIGSFSFGGKTFILDRFWVRDRTGEAVVDPARWARARANFDRVLRGEVSAAELLEGRSPFVPRMRHEVPDEVNIYLTEERSIVEVYTQDRPGLLYALADAFSSLGLSIELAKIMTEAGRVADVFYVRELSGEKLSAERQEEVRRKMLAVLGASS